MLKEWETVLGERVLFTRTADGRWHWECRNQQVKHDHATWFASQRLARLAAAAMLYAFFVFEELTSDVIDEKGRVPPLPENDPFLPPDPPPQGSGGG